MRGCKGGRGRRRWRWVRHQYMRPITVTRRCCHLHWPPSSPCLHTLASLYTSADRLGREGRCRSLKLLLRRLVLQKLQLLLMHVLRRRLIPGL